MLGCDLVSTPKWRSLSTEEQHNLLLFAFGVFSYIFTFAELSGQGKGVGD